MLTVCVIRRTLQMATTMRSEPAQVWGLIVGETGHAFCNCDLHGVYKFSQVEGVVPWYLPLRFGRVAEHSPRWIF